MNNFLRKQPWPNYIVLILALLTAYLLYAHLLGFRIFLRTDIITQTSQLIEHTFRTGGLFFFIIGAIVLLMGKRSALIFVIIGFLLYLSPWAYKYYDLAFSQGKRHLIIHMLKTYPKLTWQILPLPLGMLFFTSLSVIKYMDNKSLKHGTAQSAAP